MPARPLSGKKPKNLGYTLRTLLSYLGRHKYLLLMVAVLVTVSALANLLGTYMIRPVVNALASGGTEALLRGVLLTAAIYLTGALASLGYTQTMVKAAQKVLFDIRRDLFAHLQTLPLRFFDTRRHGDVMSYFTNDVDTISDALNNSFAMLIQSTIQVVGTFTMLFLLNWQLTLVVAVFYVLMFLYVRFSGRRSKAYYKKQQDCLGELDGYIEEMMAGQKAPSMLLPSRLARNWPVPIPLMTPPMEKDNTRRITRPIMLLTPFITLSPNSLAVMISCFVYMTHIMSSVMTTE